MLPSPPLELEGRARSKRKLGDVEAEETRDTSFQLVNLSDDSCLTFEPIGKLLRAHLPLSWLAAAHPTDVVASGSLLRGATPRITAWEYSTLVARLLPNGSLYALEKVEDDFYVLHALQPFVAAKWVADASVGAIPTVNTQMMLHYLPTSDACEPQQNNSRRTLSISSESELKIARNRKGAAARLSILGHSTKQESLRASLSLPDAPVDVDPATAEKEEKITTAPGPEKAVAAGDEGILESVHTADESMNLAVDMLSADYLRQRYLETLYTTRSPLSYYSKGPLSRARARARAADASVHLGQLAAFYRDSLLPAKRLELKYKQSIRETITQMTQAPTSEAENVKKPKKRTRLGKDGLWCVEPRYVAKWWCEVQKNSKPSTMLDTSIAQAVSALRMREAQMQILLILEIISIESKQSIPSTTLAPTSILATTTEDLDNTDVKVESIEREDGLTKQIQRSTKKRNLETDLELLADKLCIWHSIGLEDTVLSSSPTSHSEQAGTQGYSKDSLRNFCTEVLIPFYSSKLPVICKALCKTLAGPELYNRTAKAARLNDENSKTITPGAALTRRPPSRSNILERVLSDEGLRHSSPPLLLRSATLPPIPHLKREPSETPQRQLSRQTSMSFTSREVDLVADANITAVKKRKLDLVAVQKQELATAIQALKKPNRQVLAKSYMDDVEARKQKLKKPILITATPRTHRNKVLTDMESAPIPEPLLIPSSGGKRGNRQSLPTGSHYSQKKKEVLAALLGTPSRPSIKKGVDSQALSEIQKSTALSTPMVEMDSFIFATPVKQRSSAAIRTPAELRTPGTDTRRDDFVLTDVAFKVMDRAMSKPVSSHSDSIYAQLGWEDDQIGDI